MNVETPNQIQVPSQEFWTVTPFTMATPDGWTARQTVDQLVYMDVDGEPGTNCGVQWKRVSRKLSLQQIGGMSWRVTKNSDPHATLQYSKFVRINGVAAYLRLASFTKPGAAGGDRTVTGQMYAAIHGPSFGPERPVELFEIIGHFEAGNSQRAADLEAILWSFQFIGLVRPDAGDGDALAKGA